MTRTGSQMHKPGESFPPYRLALLLQVSLISQDSVRVYMGLWFLLPLLSTISGTYTAQQTWKNMSILGLLAASLTVT